MPEWNLTGSRMFSHAAKFIDAYHNVLQPLCRETGLPPMAMDILLFVANNPDRNTASDICQARNRLGSCGQAGERRAAGSGRGRKRPAQDTADLYGKGTICRRRGSQAAKGLCE